MELLVVLVPGMLLLNYVLWKRRGSGGSGGRWRRHVDAFIAVVQPAVGAEAVEDVVVLQPAGSVGRQARSEQMRGLSVLAAGMGGELQQAVAEHRAEERAEREGLEGLPPMWALAVGRSTRWLVPVALEGGAWRVVGGVERSWPRGAVRYEASGRALTVQVTITAADGSWEGRYEYARDPAKYADSVLARLQSEG